MCVHNARIENRCTMVTQSFLKVVTNYLIPTRRTSCLIGTYQTYSSIIHLCSMNLSATVSFFSHMYYRYELEVN